MVRARDASDCNGQASDRLLNCTIRRLYMQLGRIDSVFKSKGVRLCSHFRYSMQGQSAGNSLYR